MAHLCSLLSASPFAASTKVSECAGALRAGAGHHLRMHRVFRNHSSIRRHKLDSVVPRMGIKLVESFDAPLELPEASREALCDLLTNATFCGQVARDTAQAPGTELEFADILFQPVPWSPTTTKGMPAEFEKYHGDPAYVTINVPPNFLFQAKIFKPSRLCAIYCKKSAS